MLELADRHDSGSCVRKGVEVQVLSGAPDFAKASSDKSSGMLDAC